MQEATGAANNAASSANTAAGKASGTARNIQVTGRIAKMYEKMLDIKEQSEARLTAAQRSALIR